ALHRRRRRPDFAFPREPADRVEDPVDPGGDRLVHPLRRTLLGDRLTGLTQRVDAVDGDDVVELRVVGGCGLVDPTAVQPADRRLPRARHPPPPRPAPAEGWPG